MNYRQAIQNYHPSNDQEANDKAIILNYIEAFASNILTRENQIAHLTSSGLILSPALDKVLMIHHNIYKTWAWTGGHADGDTDMLEVAIKEAKEETGAAEIVPLTNEMLSIDIIPVYGHVKNGKYVSSHLHLNTAYVLIADENENLIINTEETSDVTWVDVEKLSDYSNEPYLVEIYLKLIQKAKCHLSKSKVSLI